MPRVEYHPLFADQFAALCQNPDTMEIAGEITSLIIASKNTATTWKVKLPMIPAIQWSRLGSLVRTTKNSPS